MMCADGNNKSAESVIDEIGKSQTSQLISDRDSDIRKGRKMQETSGQVESKSQTESNNNFSINRDGSVISESASID